MDLALINAVPFLMALFFALPPVRQYLPRVARAWIAAGVMLALFFALLTYFPQVQEIDAQYKEQKGISTSYEDKSADDASSEIVTDTGEATEEPIVAGAESTEDTTALDTTEATEEAVVNAEATPEAVTTSSDIDETTSDTEKIKVNAVTREIEWVPDLGLTLSFYLDGLALMFALIVTGIGAGIFLYAGFYFEDAEDQSRFLIIISVFAGAMLGLVLSGNLLTMFIMWEGTSITSFLLIGFKGKKYEDARFGASQAFTITGVGALALIAGIVVLAAISGDVINGGGMTFDLVEILQADPSAVAGHNLYAAAVILIAIGAFTKSAQFPFHFWLPGAMAAPTPASAYLHSATMVKAGIYLLLRVYPPLHDGALWTNILVPFGIFTMLMGAVISLFQRDLKALLAYLTVSWLGALVGMIGLPDYIGFKAAMVGIVAHALYKAALFLSAGTIDHNVGTRIIDELGGLRKQMPVICGVVALSVLSMAGLPFLFGFVAKEVLLKEWLTATLVGGQVWFWIICISAALSGTSGFIFLWDVFFKEPTHEIHYHASPRPMLIAPVVLAIGSLIFGLFIDPPLTFVEDLLQLAIPKAVDIPLLPPSATDPVFLTSLAIVVSGFVVFLFRKIWLPILSGIPIAKATDVYKLIIASFDWIGDQSVKLQQGKVRYYLVIILGTVAGFLLSSGIIIDLAQTQNILQDSVIDSATALRAMLLILTITAAFFTVIVRSHVTSALALGVVGYAIGGLFLIEPAPDVSLVQFLIETLATVLVIIMLGRISRKQRRDAMGKLWQGGSIFFKNYNLGILRDLLIAGSVGLAVFIFSLTALTNRAERESISQYHLENTYEQVGVTDVVGAIVADYRGMDTFVEIFVFGTAALGVLTLLTRGFSTSNPLTPRDVTMQEEFEEEALAEVQDATSLNTPFTRLAARLVLPLSFLLAISHIINGSNAPGDGFTAGAIAGVATSILFVIYGYNGIAAQRTAFSPHNLLRFGLILALVNSLLPIILRLEAAAFHAYVNYGKLLGIDGILDQFGLKLSSAVIFEIAIAATVFGGIVLIMEAIAHPKETLDIGDENT